MHILLVRHGESEGNRDRRMQGSSDYPLTEKGRAQARRLGRWLRDNDASWQAAYCSPLARAAETARIVVEATGQPGAQQRADLAEIHAGSLENKSRDDIVRDHPEYLDRHLSELGDFSDYGGESYDDIQVRVKRLVAELTALHRDAGDRVLLVAHGGLNFHLVKALVCRPVPRVCIVRWGNCTATLLRLRERRGEWAGEIAWHVPIELMGPPDPETAAGEGAGELFR